MRIRYPIRPVIKGASALFLALILLHPPAQAQNDDIGAYLIEMRDLAEEALAASRAAENASSVQEIRELADEVFTSVWGIPSGLIEETARGAEHAHGWKTRWQVTFSDFDSLFAERYGSRPPEITEPSELGIVGLGRHVRHLIEEVVAAESPDGSTEMHGPHVIHSINNVIGWMKIDDGVTKGERQPRVDLTREWNSPIEFWMSTSDTGWLFEAYSQASNILKVNYDGDVEEARRHAAGMTSLIERALEGMDANGNGTVEPLKMEGGLRAAVEHAELGGFADASD